MSLRLLAHAAYETLRVSVPTALEGHSHDPAVYDARLESWSARLLEQADVTLAVRGREHVDFGRSYVVMSNHQSHYDIPIVFQALRGLRLRMIAKHELFKIPIWARAMRQAGFIEVDREDRAQAREALSAARHQLSDRLSVWIAPEGTRSLDGHLGVFKPGGFILALDAGAPILPVTIDGSWRIHQAGSRTIHPHQTVTVTIERPIEVEGWQREHLAELVERVRSTIFGHLPVVGDTGAAS